MKVHTIIRSRGRTANLSMVMARWTFDIPATTPLERSPSHIRPNVLLFREHVTWPTAKIFRHSLGQNSAIPITRRCSAASNIMLLQLSPPLRRIRISIDFCQYHAYLCEVSRWLERYEAAPYISYTIVLFNMALVRQERFLISFWYKTDCFVRSRYLPNVTADWWEILSAILEIWDWYSSGTMSFGPLSNWPT